MIKMAFVKRRIFLGLPLLPLAGFGVVKFFSKKSTVIKTIHLQLLQPFRDFFNNNNIDPFDALHNHNNELHDDSWPGFLFGKNDVSSDFLGVYDIWLYNSSPIQLPLSATFIVNIEAGYITGYTIDIPMKSVSLADANLMADDIALKFRKQGYANTFLASQAATHQNIIDSEFYKSIWRYPIKGKIFDSFLKVTITIEQDNRARQDQAQSNIEVSNADKAGNYLIRLGCSLENDIMDELLALKDARRIAITGDRMKPISLQDWYDNPNWRPVDWKGNFV